MSDPSETRKSDRWYRFTCGCEYRAEDAGWSGKSCCGKRICPEHLTEIEAYGRKCEFQFCDTLFWWARNSIHGGAARKYCDEHRIAEENNNKTRRIMLNPRNLSTKKCLVCGKALCSFNRPKGLCFSCQAPEVNSLNYDLYEGSGRASV